MPVISCITSKGGAGKTTAIYMLADRAVASNLKVTIVDLDQTGYWSEFEENGTELPQNLRFKSATTTDELFDVVAQENEISDLVLVDTRGALDLLSLTAACISDLVIIPVKFSKLDWNEAGKTYKRLLNVSEEYPLLNMRYERIKFLWSETEVMIQTIVEKDLRQTAAEANYPFFKTAILRRAALRSALNYYKMLHQLTPAEASDVSKVASLANSFLTEVLSEYERITNYIDQQPAATAVSGA